MWCEFFGWTAVGFCQQMILFDQTLWNCMLLKLLIFNWKFLYIPSKERGGC